MIDTLHSKIDESLDSGLLASVRTRVLTEFDRQRSVMAAMQGEPMQSHAAEQMMPLQEFVRGAWHIVEADQPFVSNWHVDGLCSHIEAWVLSRIPNLLGNIPPGCMKSLLFNVFAPAWSWTFKPSLRWFHASYAQPLSTRDSLKCRKIIQSDWYQEHWGDRVELVRDQNQKTRFENTEGGWRYATSVGGGGTGEHPDLIVVDDPHNVKQSLSDVQRQEAIEWWSGTMTLRGRARGSRRAIIMQRLHERDLSGYVLESGQDFVHICLPMEFEPDRMQTTPLGWNDPRTKPGELLWPSLFSAETVKDVKTQLGSYKTAGQLQQRPAPAEGGCFQREHFKIVNALPTSCQRAVRYWDKAGTQDGGDYSAGALITYFDGIFYVADMVRGQWAAADRERVIQQTAAMDAQRPMIISIRGEREPGSGGKESGELSVQRLAGYDVAFEPVTGSKWDRAQPFAAQCQAGNVRLVAGPWNQAYIDELISFPNASHDDQVDASSGAFNHLAKPAPFLGMIVEYI